MALLKSQMKFNAEQSAITLLYMVDLQKICCLKIQEKKGYS